MRETLTNEKIEAPLDDTRREEEIPSLDEIAQIFPDAVAAIVDDVVEGNQLALVDALQASMTREGQRLLTEIEEKAITLWRNKL